MLSTIGKIYDYVEVPRKVKVSNEWKTIRVCKPDLMEHYNNFMNIVKMLEQILAKCNVRKCVRCWKTIFFIINNNVQLQCKKKYLFLEFREEPIRNLTDLN